MPAKKVLFVSGSLGLGHITRDIGIARQLRAVYPGVEISWLAGSTAASLLADRGEKMTEGAGQYGDDNAVAERVASNGHVNLIRYLLGARKEWQRNADVFGKIVSGQRFDLVVGDETYEIALALRKDHNMKKWLYAMIFDFLGLESVTANPVEKVGAWVYNRAWSYDYRKAGLVDLALFVGELEDIPDKRFGFMLPNRRACARDQGYQFVGYALPFSPEDLDQPVRVKAELGYASTTLIVCAVGGTAIGKELLELCGKAYPILKETVPDVHMVAVCGPRLDPQSLNVPDGVEVRGYVPDLYKHFAASDLAIVQGGGTTTLELSALRRPFLYFPLEGHYEQEQVVAARLARHGAGVRMKYSEASPESLARAVVANLNTSATYPPIPVEGTRNAARLIAGLLA